MVQRNIVGHVINRLKSPTVPKNIFFSCDLIRALSSTLRMKALEKVVGVAPLSPRLVQLLPYALD